MITIGGHVLSDVYYKQTNVTQFYMIGCKIVKRLNKQNYQNNAIACFLFYLELIYGMIYF